MNDKIKILWLCNIPLPKIAERENLKISNFGGWLVGLSNDLTQLSEVELVYLFPNLEKEVCGNIEGIQYIGFTGLHNMKVFENIIRIHKPNIVHIFGTEYKHSFDMINVCEKLQILDSTVINIQGLVSIYAEHYFANLPTNIVYRQTMREFFKKNNIKKQRDDFIERGKLEERTLQICKNVIGRTDWDEACTKKYNPHMRYFFCNETLRDSFYDYEWSLETCEKHSIFVSQCSYPIKGFHYMLVAMHEILKMYPDAHLYTTGLDPTTIKYKNKHKLGTYKRYLSKLIRKYNLEGKVTFLGGLNESEMCNRFLKSHIFVSPSAIENSSNSIGEAMLLGVPVVSSDVGGIKNLLEHETSGLIYQHDAPYMLAYYVKKIFSDRELAESMSENAKQRARHTHNRSINLSNMLGIYDALFKKL